MSFGGGGSSANSSTTTQLDPQIKADWQNLYGMTQNVSGGSAPQQQVAALTDGEKLAIDQTPAVLDAGADAINRGITDATSLSGYQAPTIGGQSILASSQGYSPAYAAAPSPNTISYSSVTAPQVSSSQLNEFLNPYTSDVYNTSLQQLDLARQQAINSNSATATQQGGEGAWNGSRAGTSDALTNQAFLQQASNLASTLNQSGYNSAVSALQNQQGMDLTAQQANQNAGLSAGETAYGGDLSTALANAGAANTAAQFGASAGNTASMFNAGQNLTSQADNQNASLQSAAERAQAAGLLGSLGGAQQNQVQTGLDAIYNAGAAAQGQEQNELDANYQNQMSQLLLPIQTVESAFGILPTTNSGGTSVTHSGGKSGQFGI